MTDPVLSARHVEVLRWACEGKTAAETATIMGITVATVGDHRKTAIQRLNATNIAHACVLFDRQHRDHP